MSKKKRNLSCDLIQRRKAKEYEYLQNEIANLLIPFMRSVWIEEKGILLFIRVQLSWWSLLCLGLIEIYTKLRIYYFLDPSDPIAARCHVRISRARLRSDRRRS